MITFRHAQLSNGLDVIAEINDHAQSTALGYVVKTGARDEHAAVSGVSHFLEHMLFKGTATRTAEDVNREFDEIGAQNNAYTSNEVTCYWANVLPEQTERALDLLTDMMRPALRESDFDVEKKVILEEIALYLDRPSHVLFDTVMEDHFGKHPMAHSILGSKASISKLKLSAMRNYFDAHYGPGNMVFAAAGALDFDKMIADMERLAGKWPRLNVSRVYPPATYAGARRHISDAKLKRHYIAGLCPGPSAQDELRFAAMLLADVLGDQEGSRLFWALIEPGLADEADFSFFPHDGLGSYLVYASCDPERAAQVETILHDELQSVVKKGLSDEEVFRSKNKLETGTVLSGELPLGRMRAIAGRWIYNGDYRSLEADLAILESITPQHLKDVVQQFPFAPMTMTTLGPA